MVVVGHHAPSENGPAIPLLDVANDLYELDGLVRIGEDRFTARYPVDTWYKPPSITTLGLRAISGFPYKHLIPTS